MAIHNYYYPSRDYHRNVQIIEKHEIVVWWVHLYVMDSISILCIIKCPLSRKKLSVTDRVFENGSTMFQRLFYKRPRCYLSTLFQWLFPKRYICSLSRIAARTPSLAVEPPLFHPCQTTSPSPCFVQWLVLSVIHVALAEIWLEQAVGKALGWAESSEPPPTPLPFTRS
jgi:hypothetical protein